MKKKIAGVILFGLLLLLTVYFIKWYKSRENQKYPTFIEPRIEFAMINIKEITKEQTIMDASMMINNPLPFSINLDSIHYKIYINQKEVVKSEYKKSIHLNGNDSATITLPVIIKNQVLTKVLNKLEAHHIDSADYTIEGKVFLKLPVLKDKFYNFRYSMKLPALVIPNVKIAKVRIKKLGLKHTKLLFEAKIENPNVFSLKFKNIKYRIHLDNDTLATGKIDTLISIGAKSEVSIIVPVDLSLKEAAGGVYDYLLRSDKASYLLWFKGTIVSEYNMIENSNVIVESKGSLKEIKDIQ